VAIKKLMLL